MTTARAWSGIDPFAAACASTTITPRPMTPVAPLAGLPRLRRC